MSKPREFKLYQSKDTSCLTNLDGTEVADLDSGCVFVERSAYDALRAEVERLKAEWPNNALQNTLNKTTAERDQLRNELRELKIELNIARAEDQGAAQIISQLRAKLERVRTALDTLKWPDCVKAALKELGNT